MANKRRLLPQWAIYPGIAAIAIVLFWRRLGFSGTWRISSKNQIRVDKLGDGHFGSSRSGGSRDHNGLDLVVTPGETIYSPIDGKVIRYSSPYPDDSRYSGLHIQNDKYLVKMWYLSPNQVKPGQEVTRGQALGVAQKISTKYGAGMIDHVHVEVWPGGTGPAVDPGPLFGVG
jgi:murein DD-endopeptidase MepM/ murein hydrolase activator NlpD